MRTPNSRVSKRNAYKEGFWIGRAKYPLYLVHNCRPKVIFLFKWFKAKFAKWLMFVDEISRVRRFSGPLLIWIDTVI